jgi:hypothetical protein
MSYQIKIPLDLNIHQDLQDFDYRFKYLNNQFRGRYKTTEINTSYPTKKILPAFIVSVILGCINLIAIWLIFMQRLPIWVLIPTSALFILAQFYIEKVLSDVKTLKSLTEDIIAEYNAIDTADVRTQYPMLKYTVSTLDDGIDLHVVVKQLKRGEEANLHNLVETMMTNEQSQPYSLKDAATVDLYKRMKEISNGEVYDPNYVHYIEVDELNDFTNATLNKLQLTPEEKILVYGE